MNTPSCPACTAEMLERVRSGPDGTWYFCACCASTLLVKDGEVVRVCKPL